MSTFITIETMCGICKTKFQTSEICSTNSFGSPDLDLRPPQMKRSTMPCWVKVCPNCGFARSTVEGNFKHLEYLIHSKEYKTCEGNRFKGQLSEHFYKQALVAIEEGEILTACSAFLHAAWAADDVKDVKGAIICRCKALDLYETFDYKKDENQYVQRADLLRRTGRFEQLIDEYSLFKSSNELINKIVAFQLDRAKEKDYSCYTVSDCDSVFMKLYDEPFNLIKDGKKTIEVRCNDKKRQKLKVGDKIIFTRYENPADRIRAEIVELRAFNTFRELYSAYSLETFGYNDKTVDDMVKDAYDIYSKEKEEKYGALAISIKTTSHACF